MAHEPEDYCSLLHRGKYAVAAIAHPGARQVGMGVVAQPGRHARPTRAAADRRAPFTRPAPALCVLAAGLLHCDLHGDDPPWDGNAAAELAEPWRGADHDTEPASTDISAADGYFNARELVTAQLPEGLQRGYGRKPTIGMQRPSVPGLVSDCLAPGMALKVCSSYSNFS